MSVTGIEAVLPELRPVVEMAAAAPPLDFDDIEGMRTQSDVQVEAMTGLYVPDAPAVTTEEITVPVDGGEIPVRLHRPPGTGPLPLTVYFHGGGWILGSAKQTDRICRRLADRTGAVVASVGYRRPPEHPFPTPLEDCYAALLWLVGRTGDIGVSDTGIVVGGQSAGGNLAAAVALLARDRGGPTLAGQWLDVPALDLTIPDDESLLAYGSGFGLSRADMDKTAALYAGATPRTDPYLSPLLAPSLTGLPPAVVTVAGCDPLRSQGERYAAALRDAGVPVRLSVWEGHLHATASLTTLHPSCQACEDEVVAAMAEMREPTPAS
jgi:acetyl esterase